MTGWCPYKTGALEEQECHFDGYCYECGHNKTDNISRQAAIDKLNERQRKLIYIFGFEHELVKIMDVAKSIINAIPPAEPTSYDKGYEDGYDKGYDKGYDIGRSELREEQWEDDRDRLD